MKQSQIACFERWEELLNRLGCHHGERVLYQRLITAYSEKHRTYHTLCHIDHCLDLFDKVKGHVDTPDLTELAIWYHDIVYSTRSGQNEEKSAGIAEKELSSIKMSKKRIKTVCDLIMATKYHDRPETKDAKYLIDCDLAILGADPDEFLIYERRIRKEYHWVPAILFRKKRREILNGFLNRERIYFTKWFADRFEAQARRNLQGVVEGA